MTSLDNGAFGHTAVFASGGLAGTCLPDHRIRICEDVIAELAAHLQGVYAVVGGVGALPLSDTARTVLGLAGQQPQQPQPVPAAGRARASTEASGLPTPHSHGGPDQRWAPRSAFRPLAPMVPQGATFPAADNAAGCTAAAQPAAAPADPDMPDPAQLAAMIRVLQRTVAQQHAEIVDLEAALSERKEQVHALRRKLHDSELRWFAAAADWAGLRRTESIAAPPDAPPPAPPRAAAGQWQPVYAPAAAARPRADSGNSRSTGSSTEGARRPSEYINGWPVYDSGLAPAPPAAARSTAPLQRAKTTTTAMDRTPASSAQSVPPEIVYKDSVGSGLGRGSGTSALTAPRRIYSRLASKLKRM
ncbi:hypothetical protein H4R18_000669 [Coemansia javaensis]|uniref:Uncharacterized protein n=1 Tax=Coemansia javaensis TaxID=2761396 RepID=A0A9W8HHM5_9FUNG|nr:hypothetical protein H4R18_000669 [Coemansia javaensis]